MLLFIESGRRHLRLNKVAALEPKRRVKTYFTLIGLRSKNRFDLSFLIAGASTIALFTLNTDWVFRSRKLAGRALAAFTSLYAFIYVLLRVEAYALLVGAITSFAAVAAAMYITRNVDWYGNEAPAPSFAGASYPAEPPARDSWLK